MKKLGIVAALPAEAKCLYSKKLNVALPIEIQKDIFLCLSGIGHKRALEATKKLLALKADTLISWGVAGAIDSALNSGDLIIAKQIISPDTHYTCSEPWLTNLTNTLQTSKHTVLSGDIASSDHICATIADKHSLFEKTGALAVDMESAAIAEMATTNNLDFVVIRAISDLADMAIPGAVLKHTNHLGQPHIFSFMLSCVTKPAQIREINHLAGGFKKALSTLSSVATELKNEHFFCPSA